LTDDFCFIFKGKFQGSSTLGYKVGDYIAFSHIQKDSNLKVFAKILNRQALPKSGSTYAHLLVYSKMRHDSTFLQAFPENVESPRVYVNLKNAGFLVLPQSAKEDPKICFHL